MNFYFRTKRWPISILLFFLVICFPMRAMAFDKVTHKAINEKNADKSSYLHQYLINNLGFKAGVETLINEKRITKYVGDGGGYEDAGFRSQSFSGSVEDMASFMGHVGATAHA